MCTHTNENEIWAWRPWLKVINTNQDNDVSWLLGSLPSCHGESSCVDVTQICSFYLFSWKDEGQHVDSESLTDTSRFRISASFLVLKYFCVSPRTAQRKYFSSLREWRLLSCAAEGPLLAHLLWGPICAMLQAQTVIFHDNRSPSVDPLPFPGVLWALGCHLLLPLLWQFTVSYIPFLAEKLKLQK